MWPVARGDFGTGIPPTLYGFGDVSPVEAWHRCEPPSLMASNPGLPDRTRVSQAPTRAAKTARDQKKECLGPMIRTLNLDMEDAEPRKRRCFSKSEKERINQVRKASACQACKKKHKKVGRIIQGWLGSRYSQKNSVGMWRWTLKNCMPLPPTATDRRHQFRTLWRMFRSYPPPRALIVTTKLDFVVLYLEGLFQP